MIRALKKIWKGEVKDPKMFGINCIAMEFIFVGLAFLISSVLSTFFKDFYSKEDAFASYNLIFSLTLPFQILMFVGVIRAMRKLNKKYKGRDLRFINWEERKTFAAIGSALWLIPAFYITNSF